MEGKKNILDYIKQHAELRIISRSSQSIIDEDMERRVYQPYQPQDFYFMILVVSGRSEHNIDFGEMTVFENQLLFVTPWQIHTMKKIDGTERYGISFGEELLDYISASFPFLIAPLGNQIINLDAH